MGFLDRAIKKGISKAVGNAVSNAVQNKVEPKATQWANQTADRLDEAAQMRNAEYNQNNNPTGASSNLDGALANLERAAGNYSQAVNNYATERAKRLKMCPSCETPADAGENFCPNCGTKLPETTIAQGALCTRCGKQNNIGTTFCGGCGAKLPGAIAEEQNRREKDAAVLAEWDSILSVYPKWACGGSEYVIEVDGDYQWFCAVFNNRAEAEVALEQYRGILAAGGFHPAGEYPDPTQLYNKINGVCYHVDTGMCFEGSETAPTIYFNIAEPRGGYDYVKPEQRKKVGFFDLFK